MNIGQDTTHNLPFQNGNSYNSISQIDDTLKCRPVQRYREREWFIFTYIRTCIPDKRRCRAQTKCNWVRNSIIVFQRWLMKCRLLLVNLSTKGLMVQSIASHRMPLIPFRDGNMDIFWIDESAIMHYIRGLHSEMNLMQP